MYFISKFFWLQVSTESAASRPMRSRLVEFIVRAADWASTHSKSKHHQISLLTFIVGWLPMFYYRSAIKRAWPTHRSDRSDHSPNRPRAADARPTSRATMNGTMHSTNSYSISQTRPTAALYRLQVSIWVNVTLRPVVNWWLWAWKG